MSPAARSTLLLAFAAAGPLAAASRAQVEIEGRLHLAAGPGSAWADRFSRFFDADGDGGKDFAWGGDDTDQSYLGVRVDRGNGAYEHVVSYGWLEYTIPSALTSADLDGDGVRELVYATALQYAQVLARTPAGGYQPSSAFPIASSYSGLESGDLDGDGDVDLIGVRSDGFRVHWNAGGAFPAAATAIPVAPAAFGLALGDLDGDGDLDAVTMTAADVVVLVNQGGGAFAAPVAYPAAAAALALADFDQDGRLDVVFAQSGASNVGVMLNLGSATFAPPVTSFAGMRSATIDVGDADGDGDPDVVVASALNGNGGVSVLLHQANGLFAPPASYASGATRNAALTDLDGDGDLDLALTDRDALRNRGDGTFVALPFDATTYPHETNAVAGDLDNDGDEDLLLQSYQFLSVRVNAGDGTLQAPQVIASGVQWGATELADVDGDGDLDVVSAGWNGSSVRVLPNQITSFGPLVTIAGGAGATQVEVGDLDGDGRVDLVARVGNAFAAALNTGGATWTAFATIASAAPGPGGWDLADFDGDGDPDFVTSANVGLQLHANQGGLAFAPPVVIAPAPSFANVLASDVDGDGDQDIVTTGGTQTRVLWNQGGGAFPLATVLGPSTTRYRTEDLDGDGDLDVLGAFGGTRGDAFEYLGGTSFAPPRHFGIAGAPSLAAIDLDADGDQDAIGASYGRVFVLENGGASGATFCAGDGAGTACPCGNASPVDAGLGCLNSAGRAGALRASGSTSMLTDTLELRGAGMTNSSALYFQGTSVVAGGAGSVFGDGLRCVTGSVVRLGVRTNAAGASTFPGAGQPPLRVLGHVTAPGTRHYQVWYRDAQSFCTSATWNLTNGLSVTWGA